ncbi:MAG: helix-turn-helix transcriptional regulator [Tenericutes bacterium]|nr:helix-turn-helix transcriptional regulator [Mycoplasmatota bacterium]
MNDNEIGLFIKNLREEKKLTQLQLGEMLNITDKAISKWESGMGLPDTLTFPKLANIFGVTTDELLSGKKTKKKFKTKYEIALELDDIELMESFLKNIDLNNQDEKGNTFLDSVMICDYKQYIPFCFSRRLFDINNEGYIIVDGIISVYETKIAKTIIENLYKKDWIHLDKEFDKIKLRHYSLDELKLIIEIASYMEEKTKEHFNTLIYVMLILRYSKDINQYIAESLENLYIKLKLNTYSDTNQLFTKMHSFLVKEKIILTDQLVNYFDKNNILFIDKVNSAKTLLTTNGYSIYANTLRRVGDIEEIIKISNIYEEYKKRNWLFIDKVIDRKETSSELYSVAGMIEPITKFDNFTHEIVGYRVKPKFETEYELAKFFNEDYPDVVERIIRKGKGIPENRPHLDTNTGFLSMRENTGMSVSFIKTLLKYLIERIDTLEESLESNNNK